MFLHETCSGLVEQCSSNRDLDMQWIQSTEIFLHEACSGLLVCSCIKHAVG